MVFYRKMWWHIGRCGSQEDVVARTVQHFFTATLMLLKKQSREEAIMSEHFYLGSTVKLSKKGRSPQKSVRSTSPGRNFRTYKFECLEEFSNFEFEYLEMVGVNSSLCCTKTWT